MSTRAAIIGAGVIGLTSAWRLAAAGVEVVLIDPRPARGASWAAAGMLAPVTELNYGEEALLGLNLAARDRWREHGPALAASGLDVGYAECGSLLVARDADDAAEHRRLLAFHEELGLRVEWLRGKELRALEPALAPSVRSGIRVDGDHRVDNRALVGGLLEWCEADDRVRVVRREALAVRPDPPAVRVDAGEWIEADAVVVAAGAHTPRIDGVRPARPIRPLKGQLLHLRLPDGQVFERNLRGVECYMVGRRDGRVAVGATMEERGFDERPTAGAVHELLRAAWELVPGIAEATFLEVAVGWRPSTPDNGPLLGPVEEDGGVIMAAGHHRNGVLQSALTADAVHAWVTGRPVPTAVTTFLRRREAVAA